MKGTLWNGETIKVDKLNIKLYVKRKINNVLSKKEMSIIELRIIIEYYKYFCHKCLFYYDGYGKLA